MKYIKCSHCGRYIPTYYPLFAGFCPLCDAPITKEEIEKATIYYPCPICDTLMNVASSPFYCKVCGRKLYLDEEDNLLAYSISKEY